MEDKKSRLELILDHKTNLSKTKAGKTEYIYSYIGRRIREARQKKGLTQGEIAEKVGIGRTSIVNLEAGRQRCMAHTLMEICFALDLEMVNIFPKKGEDISLAPLELAILELPNGAKILELLETDTDE